MEENKNIVAQDATTPAPSLEQLTLEVKFYLGQTAQNIIEVGKRLTQAKGMLPHGEWGDWLKENFQLAERTAQRFMACAERFGTKTTLMSDLKPTQMIQLLALPEAESESFIEAKAAEGNPVEDMTVKKLREEIEKWKTKAEAAEKSRDEIAEEYSLAQQNSSRLRQERNTAIRERDSAVEALDSRPLVTVVKTPDDYEATKQENARLRKSLAERPFEVPADYHANKLALASAQKELEQTQSSLRNEVVAFQRIKRQLGETEDELQRRIDEEHDANHHAAIFHKLDVLDQILSEVATAKDIAKILADYKETQSMHYNGLRRGLKELIQRITANEESSK